MSFWFECLFYLVLFGSWNKLPYRKYGAFIVRWTDWLTGECAGGQVAGCIFWNYRKFEEKILNIDVSFNYQDLNPRIEEYGPKENHSSQHNIKVVIIGFVIKVFFSVQGLSRVHFTRQTHSSLRSPSSLIHLANCFLLVINQFV